MTNDQLIFETVTATVENSPGVEFTFLLEPWEKGIQRWVDIFQQRGACSSYPEQLTQLNAGLQMDKQLIDNGDWLLAQVTFQFVDLTSVLTLRASGANCVAMLISYTKFDDPYTWTPEANVILSNSPESDKSFDSAQLDPEKQYFIEAFAYSGRIEIVLDMAFIVKEPFLEKNFPMCNFKLPSAPGVIRVLPPDEQTSPQQWQMPLQSQTPLANFTAPVPQLTFQGRTI